MTDEKDPQQPGTPDDIVPDADAPPPPSSPAPPSPPAPPPAGGQASSRATLSLILGIVGIVLCPPAAVAAWIVSAQERKAIAAGQSPQAGQGLATAGWIMGIIGTIIMILIILMIGFFVAAAAIMGGSNFSQMDY